MKLERMAVVIALCLAVLAAAGAFAAEPPQPESPAPAPTVSEPVAPVVPPDLAGLPPEPIFLVWPPPSGCPPPPAYPCYTHTDCTGYCGGPGYCYKTGGSNCGRCLCQ